MADSKQNYPQEEPASDNQKQIVKIVLIVLGVLVLLGILSTVLFGVFVSKAGEEIVEQATNSEITTNDDGSVSLETEDGSATFNATELPEDFPREVPLFEPASLAQSSSIGGGSDEEKIWTVNFNSTATPNEVYDYYESVLSRDGWEITNTLNSGQYRTLGAANEGAGLSIQLGVDTATEENFTSHFSLTVSRGIN